MKFFAASLLAVSLCLATSGTCAANICSEILAKIGADTQPKRAMLRLAALENDVESACLLLQHGLIVNEIDE